jgi:hypothetical protein
VAVKAAVKEAMSRTRVPATLTGTIEGIDEDKDIAYVRMDFEAMSGDPTESLNYELPGVIATTRLGEEYDGDQVRTVFDGTAGAHSQRTSSENIIVLPYGAETGRRIVLDGNLGTVSYYDDSGALVGIVDTDQWAIGNVDPPGARVTLDPLGGLRIRAANNQLVAIIDQNGYTIRDATSGLVVAEIGQGTFRMVDPVGTDTIEMITASAGSLPNPSCVQAVEVNPGSSLVAPAAPVFTTTPADDIEIMHVAAWIRAVNQAATMTPPAGATVAERLDMNSAAAVGTLQTSVATRDPADGLAGTFTSTQSNWQHGLGTHVVIKGGGTTSPAFRSISSAHLETTAAVDTVTITKPAGVVAGDALLVFVTLGVSGGGVPTGWVTPTGFKQLGATFTMSGTGLTQTALSAGAWIKFADASDVAATEYSTTINLPTGTKVIDGAMVAISNPAQIPGGVQILMAGKPIRRLLAYTELAAASAILCDFQNISQGYDNLELVYDGGSNSTSAAQQLRVRFNGDTGIHYAYKVVRDGILLVGAAGSGVGATQIQFGATGDAVGARTAGTLNIYGYKSSPKPVVIGRNWWVGTGPAPHDEEFSGQWDGNLGVSAINRIVLELNAAGPQFAAGSRAYLYGY